MEVIVGRWAIVATEGGKPGVVRHVCPDGYVGVALVNEKGRVDEWPPAMVRAVSPAEASAAAARFVRVSAEGVVCHGEA